MLVLSPNVCNSRGYTKPKPEVRNSTKVSHVGSKHPGTASQAAHLQETRLEEQLVRKPMMSEKRCGCLTECLDQTSATCPLHLGVLCECTGQRRQVTTQLNFGLCHQHGSWFWPDTVPAVGGDTVFLCWPFKGIKQIKQILHSLYYQGTLFSKERQEIFFQLYSQGLFKGSLYYRDMEI